MPQTELEIRLFGYDAVQDSTRRRAPSTDMRSEDEQLRWHERDKLIATSRDALRNWVMTGWMLRKHLDFVADFSFQANTPNDAFNDQLKKLVRNQSKRRVAHIGGRHPLRRLMRIQEACRTLDGDVLFEKMRNKSLNLVRGDLIRNPRGKFNSREWVNGVHISRTKSPIEYQVYSRYRGRYTPDKRIPARNAILNGYFEADADQQRGVSKLTTAINSMRDSYESIDFALARMKVEQLFGSVVTKELPADGGNPFAGNRKYSEAAEDATPEEIKELAKEEDRSGFVNFGKGPFQAELRPGEDMKFLSGNMPSSNFQSFINTCVHLVLKSLDIPISFFDEAWTNYYGQRGALQHYKRSASSKQDDNAEVLEEITRWWLIHWVIDDQITLPPGWTVDDVEFAWVPHGIPWWDRSKEIIGDMRAIGAGLDNPENVCLNHGQASPFENIDKTAKVLEHAKKKLGPFGLTLNFDPSQIALEEMEEAIANAKNQE